MGPLSTGVGDQLELIFQRQIFVLQRKTEPLSQREKPPGESQKVKSGGNVKFKKRSQTRAKKQVRRIYTISTQNSKANPTVVLSGPQLPALESYRAKHVFLTNGYFEYITGWFI